MKRPTTAPDWAQIITDMMGAGLNHADIGSQCGGMLTNRMIFHYKHGAQPAYWRGELMVNLWCKTLRKERDMIPMTPLIRGHRARGSYSEPTIKVNLPAWPPVSAPAPEAVKPIKRRGRPPKVRDLAEV